MNRKKMIDDEDEDGESHDYSPDREDEKRPSKNVTKIFSSVKKNKPSNTSAGKQGGKN